MNEYLQIFITAIVSGSVISAVLGIIFHRRGKAIEADIRRQVEQSLAIFQSKRAWKESAISELLGPIRMQLDRTERAFGRWKDKNLYLESKIIREGNLIIRDLLLNKGHLIPPELLDDAGLLIEHYDRWLEEFEKRRVEQKPGDDTPFVFVGPDGFPFPRISAKKFQSTFEKFWSDLYSTS